MWKISFHVMRAHLGNPTFQGGKLKIVIGLTKASRQRKGESTKSQEKGVRHKRGNSGPKEGAVSIIRFNYKSRKAIKFVIRKSMQQLTKGGHRFHFEGSITKVGKAKKTVIGKSRKLWA